jgi:hypothetical protein
MIMSVYARCTIVLLLAALIGCGGNAPGRTSPIDQPTVLNLTGNWELFGVSSPPGSSSIDIGASLTSNGAQITGIAHITSSVCYPPFQTAHLSGTITAENDIAISSDVVTGQVLTLAGSVSPDGKVMVGNYSVSGGCADGNHGSLAAFLVPSFTNSYAGTLAELGSGNSISVVFSLTQTDTADELGFFHVTGTASSADSPCFSSATASNSSMVFGDHIGVSFTTNGGDEMFFGGSATDLSGKTLAGTLQISSGVCAGESLIGRLTRQ